MFATAFGLSALIAASPGAFDMVRYTGAAYLGYLACASGCPVTRRRARSRRRPRKPYRRVFGDGIVVNLLNPKTAIFFFAFLPQFVDPAGNVRLQLVLLGLMFSAMGVVTDAFYATAAGRMGRRLRDDPRLWNVRRMVAGAVYAGLAVVAVFVHPTKQWTPDDASA